MVILIPLCRIGLDFLATFPIFPSILSIYLSRKSLSQMWPLHVLSCYCCLHPSGTHRHTTTRSLHGKWVLHVMATRYGLYRKLAAYYRIQISAFILDLSHHSTISHALHVRELQLQATI
jgi:hypothetical protein